MTIKSLLLISMGALPAMTHAQPNTVIAASDRENTLYSGIDNPISLAIPGYPCEQTYATINKGTLAGSGCHYTALALEPGEATIMAYYINACDTLSDTIPVSEVKFRVKKLPNPVVRISGRRNDNMTKGELMVQKGPYAVLEGFDLDIKYKITSFWVRHYSSNNKIKDVYNDGTLFNAEAQEMFNASFSGDIFRFYNILALTPDGREIELEPMELYVKNKF